MQVRADQGGRCDEVVKLRMGTATVMTLYPREEESMGVPAHRLQLAQQFCKEGYHVLGLQEKGEEICTVSMRRMARMDSGSGLLKT